MDEDINCPTGQQHFRPGGSIGTYEPSPGTWDWQNDPHQLQVLLAARQLIPTSQALFEGFANSAPDWMLQNSCSKGASTGGNNLSINREQDYANYLAHLIAYFGSQYHIYFHSIEPFNEPNANWWKPGENQEGMHVSVDQQERVIKDLYNALQQNGDYGTSISSPDENSIDETLQDAQSYDQTTLADIGQINTHSYNGSNLLSLYEKSQQDGLPLWMSEYTTNGGGSHLCADSEDTASSRLMKGAFWLSCRISDDLNTMHSAAWIYWQAVENDNDAFGLLQTDFSTKAGPYEGSVACSDPAKNVLSSHTFCYTKQFYALWQFSHFIHPGYQIIGVTGSPQSMAAFDPISHTVVIVTTNDTARPLHITYNLAKFAHIAGPIAVYRTSPTENGQHLVSSPPTLSGQGFTADVSPQSITTYVISGADSSYLNNIDWANFVYPVGPCSGNQQAVAVQNGKGVDNMIQVGIDSSSAVYGDLTGNGQPAAVLLVSCTGADYWAEALVYSGSAAHPHYLGNFLQDTPFFTEIDSATIDQQAHPATITLRGRGGGTAICCPANMVTVMLRWNGSRFVAVKQVQIPINQMSTT
jgi:O-glycosyl hydrolase